MKLHDGICIKNFNKGECMFARLISAFAVLFACAQQPCFAGDVYVGFDYFFKPIPPMAPTYKSVLVKSTVYVKDTVVVNDSATVETSYGVWCFKPSLTVTATAFDRKGNSYPFSGAGAGISFQKEIKTSFLKDVDVVFQADLDYLMFNVAGKIGNGPALLVGAYGATAGPAYDVKNKVWYGILNYSITLFKN